MSFALLVLKLVFSLVFYLLLFFLEKIFANKFFLRINIGLTSVALILLVINTFTPGFNKPEEPSKLTLSDENVKIIEISSQEALNIINNIEHEKKLVSQKFYLNLANLSLVGEDKKTADYFLQTVRYINPNSDFIE